MAVGVVRLFLVRHGEVDANVSYRFLGSTDDPLNDRGLAQANRLAELFSALRCDAICSSPLGRALETARAIASRNDLEVHRDDRLRELDFGRWEGLTRRQIEELDPDHVELLGRWDQDPAVPAPDGESLLAVQGRTIAFADETADERSGQVVIVVTHMGPIKALLCAALGCSLASARRLFLDPATVSVVDWSSRPVVRLFNSHAHLGWPEARWLRTEPGPRPR